MRLRLSRQREARQAPRSNFGTTSAMAQPRGPCQVAEVQCRRQRQCERRVASLATAPSYMHP
eukprot:11033964-Prorocentrum_lima.AAC.1